MFNIKQIKVRIFWTILSIYLVNQIEQVQGAYNRLVQCSNGGYFKGINVYQNPDRQIQGIDLVCSRDNTTVQGVGSVGHGYYFGSYPQSQTQIIYGSCADGQALAGIQTVHQNSRIFLSEQNITIQPLIGIDLQCCNLPQNLCKNTYRQWNTSGCTTLFIGLNGQKDKEKAQDIQCTSNQILQTLELSYIDGLGLWDIASKSCRNLNLRVGNGNEDCSLFRDVQCQGILADYCYWSQPISAQDKQNFPYGFYQCEVAGKPYPTMPGEVLLTDFQNSKYSLQCSNTQEINGAWFQVRSQNLNACMQMSQGGWSGFHPCNGSEYGQWFRFNSYTMPRNTSLLTFDTYEKIESAIFPGRCIEPPLGGSFVVSPSKLAPYQQASMVVDSQDNKVKYQNKSSSQINTLGYQSSLEGTVWELVQPGSEQGSGALLRNPASGLCVSKAAGPDQNASAIYAVGCDFKSSTQRWSLGPAKSKLGVNFIDEQFNCIAFPDPSNASQTASTELILLNQYECQNSPSLAAFELLATAKDATSCLTASAQFRFISQNNNIQFQISNLTTNQCLQANQDVDGIQYMSIGACPTQAIQAFKFDIIPVNVGPTWQDEIPLMQQIIQDVGINTVSSMMTKSYNINAMNYLGMLNQNLSDSPQLLQQSPSYCFWTFIRCDMYGRVVSIQVNQLAKVITSSSATIGSQIFQLTRLTAFSVRNVNIFGGFPSSQSCMSNLRALDFSYTSLSGPLPSQWPVQMKQMQYLQTHNTGVSGQIQQEYFELKSFNANSTILVDTSGVPRTDLCGYKNLETMPKRFPLGHYNNTLIPLCPNIYDESNPLLITIKLTASKCMQCSDMRLQMGQVYSGILQNYSLWPQSTYQTNCTFTQLSDCAKNQDQKSLVGLKRRALSQSSSDRSISVTLQLLAFFITQPSNFGSFTKSVLEAMKSYSILNEFTSEISLIYAGNLIGSAKTSQGVKLMLASGYISLIVVVGFLTLVATGFLIWFFFRRKDRQRYYQAKLKKRNLAKFDKTSEGRQLGIRLLQSRDSQSASHNQSQEDLLEKSLRQAINFYHQGSNHNTKSVNLDNAQGQGRQLSGDSRNRDAQQARINTDTNTITQRRSTIQKLKTHSRKLLSNKSSNLVSLSSCSSNSSASTLVIRMNSGNDLEKAFNRDRGDGLVGDGNFDQLATLDKIDEDVREEGKGEDKEIALQQGFQAQMKGPQLLMNATNLMQLYYSQTNKQRNTGQQDKGEKPQVKELAEQIPKIPSKEYNYSISQILDTTSTINPESKSSGTQYLTKQIGPEFLDFQIRLMIRMLNDSYELVEPIENYQHLGSHSYIIFIKKNLSGVDLNVNTHSKDEIQEVLNDGLNQKDQQQNQKQYSPSKTFQIYAVKFYFYQAAFEREVGIYKNGQLHSVVPSVSQIHYGSTAFLVRYQELVNQGRRSEAQEAIQDSNNIKQCLSFMVLEAGETLKSWQKRHKDRALNQAQHIVCQVGGLVQTLHNNNIVHGNLSTSHIVWDDTVKAWKLIDFSCCAKITPKGHVLHHQNSLGTPYKFQFSPPEVALALDPQRISPDIKIDVWALGMIAYNLYTTDCFFHSKVKNDVVQEYLKDFRRFARRLEVGKLSKQLEQVGQVIMQMLGKCPRYRPSVEQALKQLEQCSEAIWNQKQVKLMLGAMAHWPETGQESQSGVASKYLNVQVSIKQDPSDDSSDKVVLLKYNPKKGDDVPTYGIVPGTPFYLNFRLKAQNIDEMSIKIPLSSTRVVIMDIKKPQKGQILILIPNMLATSDDMWEFQALWDSTKHNIEALNEENEGGQHLEGVVNLVVIQQLREEMVERVIRLSKRIKFQTLTAERIVDFKNSQAVKLQPELLKNTFTAKFSVDE